MDSSAAPSTIMDSGAGAGAGFFISIPNVVVEFKLTFLMIFCEDAVAAFEIFFEVAGAIAEDDDVGMNNFVSGVGRITRAGAGAGAETISPF
jgi:hypothetical protein